MKKTLLKTFGAAALLLTAASAQAQVNFAGTYTVTGTCVLYENGTYAGSEERTFTLEIDANNRVLQMAGYNMSSLPSSQAIIGIVEGNKFSFPTDVTLWLEAGPQYLVLGNDDYEEEYAQQDIALSYEDDEWVLTGFSVWEQNWTTDPMTMTRIQYWSDYGMTVTKTSGDDSNPGQPSEPSDNPFIGEFEFEGSCYNYSTGDTTVETIKIVINEENQVTQFADYDLLPLINEGYIIKGDITGNTFTFTGVWGMYLAFGGGNFTLLGNSSYLPEYEDTDITLKYNNGIYELSDFSIWSGPYGDYSRDEYWSNLTYVGGESEEPVPPVDETDYSGVYTAVGTQVVYSDGVAGAPVTNSFLMEMELIDGRYQFIEFAGYEIPESGYGGQGVVGVEEDDVISIFGQNSILSAAGPIMDKLSGDNTEVYSEEIDTHEFSDTYLYIVFDNENGEGSGYISDFTVWNYDWGTDVYTLLESWTDVTFTEGDTTAGIRDIESSLDVNAPVEFFNLQGQKVKNPSNGIFIRKQGKSATKVLVK